MSKWFCSALIPCPLVVHTSRSIYRKRAKASRVSRDAACQRMFQRLLIQFLHIMYSRSFEFSMALSCCCDVYDARTTDLLMAMRTLFLVFKACYGYNSLMLAMAMWRFCHTSHYSCAPGDLVC